MSQPTPNQLEDLAEVMGIAPAGSIVSALATSYLPFRCVAVVDGCVCLYYRTPLGRWETATAQLTNGAPVTMREVAERAADALGLSLKGYGR